MKSKKSRLTYDQSYPFTCSKSQLFAIFEVIIFLFNFKVVGLRHPLIPLVFVKSMLIR